MSSTDRFEAMRPRLFGIAYRMTGSVMEAEELVQEGYLRWQRAPHEEIVSPDGYLVRIVTRLALDRLRSASARREEYIGSWLPEPLVSAPDALERRVERREALSVAFLLLLERLAPLERAIFLLREVFDYDYATIATIVERREATCRQIARRARLRVAEGQPRFEPAPARREALTQQFLQSCAEGDLATLITLLSDGVVALSDSGGLVPAARRPIVGAERVARFLLGIIRLAPKGIVPHPCTINGSPALYTTVDGRPYSALTLAFDGEKICAIYNLLSPEKLRALDHHP